MRHALSGFAMMLTLGLATTAHADKVVYADPYAEPAHGLRFADLEASVGTDPRVWSTDPRWDAHRTPPAMLARANQALRAAVPAGTTAGLAAAVLEKAGAHCAGAAANELKCSYHDVETPFGGADWDNVTWQVDLALTNGHVSDLAVTRYWTRR
jgi:hypothetical protein